VRDIRPDTITTAAARCKFGERPPSTARISVCPTRTRPIATMRNIDMTTHSTEWDQRLACRAPALRPTTRGWSPASAPR